MLKSIFGGVKAASPLSLPQIWVLLRQFPESLLSLAMTPRPAVEGTPPQRRLPIFLPGGGNRSNNCKVALRRRVLACLAMSTSRCTHRQAGFLRRIYSPAFAMWGITPKPHPTLGAVSGIISLIEDAMIGTSSCPDAEQKRETLAESHSRQTQPKPPVSTTLNGMDCTFSIK